MAGQVLEIVPGDIRWFRKEQRRHRLARKGGRWERVKPVRIDREISPGVFWSLEDCQSHLCREANLVAKDPHQVEVPSMQKRLWGSFNL